MSGRRFLLKYQECVVKHWTRAVLLEASTVRSFSLESFKGRVPWTSKMVIVGSTPAWMLCSNLGSKLHHFPKVRGPKTTFDKL